MTAASPPLAAVSRCALCVAALLPVGSGKAVGMHMAELSGDNVACRRGERHVFADVSFSLRSGGALVLIGRNGAGKSSLLRMLAGLLPVADGHIAWDGVDIARDHDLHRTRVRFVGHADAVKPALSVVENLHPWAVLWGGHASARGAYTRGPRAPRHRATGRNARSPAFRRAAAASLSPGCCWRRRRFGCSTNRAPGSTVMR
ncbi:MAG: ATP-binding cassette domain-containing protein [Rhodospirillales bacterium]|nr:ATP-binding cassette domain-containing protein [Rhodospirillales bacterium]